MLVVGVLMLIFGHASASAAGPVKTAVVIFKLQATDPDPVSVATMRDRTFTGANSANQLYKDSSNNSMSLVGVEDAANGDVFGPYVLNTVAAGCTADGLALKAKLMAAADGHNMAAYDQIAYVFPDNVQNCLSGAYSLSDVDQVYMDASHASSYTMAHELGHSIGNFGEGHGDRCTVAGQFVAVQPNQVCESGTQSAAYGDNQEVMGNFMRLFGGPHRVRVGALPPQNVTTVGDYGEYSIKPLTTTPSLGTTQLLRIPIDNGDFYYLDFRQPTGVFDVSSSGSYMQYNGVEVRRSNDVLGEFSTDSYAVNTIPNSQNVLNDDATNLGYLAVGREVTQALLAGRSFYDPIHDSTISTISVSPTEAKIRYQAGSPAQPSVVDVANGQLRFQAASGQSNDVGVTLDDPSTYRIVDNGGPLTAGTGCAQVTRSQVTCSSSGVASLQINLGDKDDGFRNGTDTPSTIDDGPGDDVIAGGGGDDTLIVGPGNDDLGPGSGGFDTLSYAGRTHPVKAPVPNRSGGEVGETDRVFQMFHHFSHWVLGSGDDTFDDCGFDGCVVDGGDGADKISAGEHSATINGGPGNDEITVGGFSSNTANGDDGDDVIDAVGAHPTTDTISGGNGNDIVSSVDGVADQLDCGTGSNNKVSETLDSVNANCGSQMTAVNTVYDGGVADGDSINANYAYFAARAVPNVPVTYECNYDGGSWFPCSSASNQSGIPEGSHTYAMRAVLISTGLADPSPLVRNFTVDTQIPTVSIATPTSGQQLGSGDGSLTFVASADVVSATCSIDGSAASPCASPTQFTLDDGAHTVTVVVSDAAGNSATAIRSFSVLQAAQTSISSGPADGGYSAAGSTAFTFTSPSGGATFQCSVDAGAYQTCTSPFAASLADGAHSFAVRAVVGGNPDTTPSTRSFTVDTVPPALAIQQPTDGQAVSTNSLTANFTYEYAANVSCRFDSDPAVKCGSPATLPIPGGGVHTLTIAATDVAGNVTSVTRTVNIAATPDTSIVGGPAEGAIVHSPITFGYSSTIAGSTFECRTGDGQYHGCSLGASAYAEMSHKFSVRAIAPNGMIDPTPAIRHFTYDSLPVVSIANPSAGSTIDSSTVPVQLSINDGVQGPIALDVVSARCRLDSGAWYACDTAPTLTGVTAGSHTLFVEATDKTGNVGATSVQFNATPIDTAITSGPANNSYVSSLSNSFTFTGSKAGATFECWVEDNFTGQCSSGFTVSTDQQGVHRFAVRAVGVPGDVDPSPEQRSYTVDTIPPVVNITAPMTGSATANTTPALTFTVTEVNSHTETCQIDDGTLTSCPSTLGPLTPGSHTVTVRSTDAAGNIGSAATTFTVLNPELRQVASLAVPSGTENLTTQGTVDWSHWGTTASTSWDHKAAGTQFSDLTQLNTPGLTRLTTGVAPTVSWGDGVTGTGKTASTNGTATGVTNANSGVNKGYSFTVAALQNSELVTLRLHVGVLNSQGKLELYWASNPTNIVSDTSLSTSSTTTPANAVYQVVLRPPTASDTLNVRWTQNTSPSTTTSKVRIYSASLTKVGATRATAPTSANLTTDGVPPGVSLDWAHWGGTSSLPASPLIPIGKNGATQISNALLENGGAAAQSTATTNPVTTAFSWTNGDTTASASNIKTGIYNTGTTTAGRGFSFTVPAASANAETLKLYVGVTNTSTTAARPAKLELFWGANTIPVYTDIVPSLTNSTVNYVYTINLRHVTAGTTLKAKWSTNTTSTSHRVTLQSAVLLQG